MSQIVIDTDVASYIFNWHSSAQRYLDAFRGSELVLSFMSIAEMRMGAIAAGWGHRRRTLLEHFIGGFGAIYADDALCSAWAKLGLTLEPGPWDLRTLGSLRRRSASRHPWPRTIAETSSIFRSFGS
jgi:hypothetical protein